MIVSNNNLLFLFIVLFNDGKWPRGASDINKENPPKGNYDKLMVCCSDATQLKSKKESAGERERDSSVFLCEGIRLDYAYVRVRPVCVVCKVQLKCTGTQ